MSQDTPDAPRRRRRAALRTVLVAGIIVLAAACSSSGSSSSPTAPPTPLPSGSHNNPGGSRVQACETVTAQDVGGVLGTPVGDGDQIVAGAGDAAYSTCTYKTTDADPERTVIVTIHPLTAAETPEAIKDQQETDARTGEFDEIPNLGDFSYWIEDKGELNTFCGPNWIIITADGADGKPDLETAKQLMQVTMTNLYCLPISPTILPS